MEYSFLMPKILMKFQWGVIPTGLSNTYEVRKIGKMYNIY